MKTTLGLLKEARATLRMWADVAPAVSLCKDIDEALTAIAAAPQVVAYERGLPPLPEMASAADLAHVTQTPEDWDGDYRNTWQKLQVEAHNKREWRKYALELRALAATPSQAQVVADERAACRAAGRAEALAILMGLCPETGIDEYTGWSSSGSPEDEGCAHWKEAKLRELLHVDSALADMMGKAEAAYYDYRGQKDEADRAKAFAANMHSSGRVREVLAKAGEHDLIGQLCSAAVPAQAQEPFMYGIMGPDGKAHIDENCVGPDAESLYSELNGLNDSPDAGHTIVKLFTAPVQAQEPRPELTVWYGAMPESNGKSNFTAMLVRKDAQGLDKFDGFTIACSEYPDRVRYEADCMRHLIGELEGDPDILAYDADKHSGYIAPVQPVSVLDAEEFGFKAVRLRRTAFLLGLEGAIPDNDKDLMDCMGAVLGMICREVERLAAPAAQPLPVVEPDESKPVSWLCTDLDGHGDVGFTKEVAKERAGYSCDHFIPLFDIAAPAAQGDAEDAQSEFSPTERQFKEWCERHDMQENVSREAFDDASSLYLLDRAAIAAAPVKAQGDAKDAERYRWLRDPDINVGLVIDKRTGFTPEDETIPGIGGYYTYEYRAGAELDVAIDAAIAAKAAP